MPTKKDRCWPGYEPVPGKAQHEEGSCRPKADSKLTPSEKDFRSKRKKQLASWQKTHGSPKKAAQHLGAPGTTKVAKTKAAKKATAKKKTAAAKKTARKPSAKRPSA